MALTMKTFGRLVSVVSYWCNHSLDSGQIESLHAVSEEIAAANLMASTVRPVVDLVPLFNFIIQGEKISAIKEYRSLTGMGLRESKDEVERLMETKFPA